MLMDFSFTLKFAVYYPPKFGILIPSLRSRPDQVVSGSSWRLDTVPERLMGKPRKLMGKPSQVRILSVSNFCFRQPYEILQGLRTSLGTPT